MQPQSWPHAQQHAQLHVPQRMCSGHLLLFRAVPCPHTLLTFPPVQEVTESENFYHFTLHWPNAPSTSSSSSYWTQLAYGGARLGRTWVLGCHTRGDRQQWIEAVLNAQRPAEEQVCWMVDVVKGWGTGGT